MERYTHSIPVRLSPLLIGNVKVGSALIRKGRPVVCYRVGVSDLWFRYIDANGSSFAWRDVWPFAASPGEENMAESWASQWKLVGEP